MPNNQQQKAKPAGPKQATSAPRAKASVPAKKTSVPPQVKADQKLERALVNEERRVTNHDQRQKAESVLLIPKIGSGFSRPTFPVERIPDSAETCNVILAFTGFFMAFVPKGTAAQCDAMNGCFLDDLRLACMGKRSLFQVAPKVWWELRHALQPCLNGEFSFTYDPPAAALTYGSSSSLLALGTQPTSFVTTGTACVASVPYSASIAVANADYDICSDMFAYAGKHMKVIPNPYENKQNTDPSAFSVYLSNTTGSYSIGAQTGTSNLHTDYNRYGDTKIRTRWLASLALQAQDGVANWPLRWSYMTSSASTEIGHRLFCDSVGAPEVKGFTPIVMPVSLLDLVKRTLKAFNQALLTGGVAASAITTQGSFEAAAYLIGCIHEWFAPWSQVAYPRGYINGSATRYYVATSGCNIQNTWKNKPIPACLAVNLSYLIPCADFEKKRVYYPVLQQDCTPQDFVRTTYTVFATDYITNSPWGSYITQQWSQWFDVGGALTTLFNQYSTYIPMRSLPHMAACRSLACTAILQYYTGGTTNVAASTHEPDDSERDLFSMMVLPFLAGNINAMFFEQARHGDFRYFTILPNAFDASSYYGFTFSNNNMLSSSAKVLLDQYDQSQEAPQEGVGFVGSVLSGLASGYGVVKGVVTTASALKLGMDFMNAIQLNGQLRRRT